MNRRSSRPYFNAECKLESTTNRRLENPPYERRCRAGATTDMQAQWTLLSLYLAATRFFFSAPMGRHVWYLTFVERNSCRTAKMSESICAVIL